MQGKLSTALFLIRISVALVLIMWTVDNLLTHHMQLTFLTIFTLSAASARKS